MSNDSLSSNDEKLIDLIAETDILTNQLYHLQNFHSILSYDPTPENILLNKDSESFKIYENDNNLSIWPKSNKRQTRRLLNNDNDNLIKLKNKLNKFVNQRISEKLDFDDNTNIDSNKRKYDDNSNHERNNTKDTPTTKKQKIIHLPKIKFKISIKPPIISHPDHKPVHKFENINQLFDSYRNIIEDPAPEIESDKFNEYLENQHELIKSIDHAINEKELLYIDYNENPFRNVPNGVREPTMIKRNLDYNINNYKLSENPFRMKNELSHYDHLIAQGLKSSKLIRDLRSNKIQKCKRIAQMIEVHFKRLSQENDKKEKEFQKKIYRLARDTAKEVKKKWNIAVKAYKVLEERENEHLRLKKSKEQLSKILDHSTKVLGAQMITKSSNNNSSVEPEKIQSENNSEDDDSESHSESDNFSSSSSDEDDHMSIDQNENIPVDDDSKLSDEKLKEKYEKLKNFNINGTDSNDNNNNSSLSLLYKDDTSEKIPTIVDNLDESVRIKLLEENSNPLLDEDSNSSSDDSDLSDSDESSLSSNESDYSIDEENKPGLHSLFNTGNDEGNDEDEDEEDDESVYSEPNQNDETPSSSPEKTELLDEQGIPDVPTPILLKGTLRPYQKQGLNWLASLYNNGTNGILADEMGLGKTIQTISLLSYLACEKNIWGPHLIVVPTSVMLNWEMEFKRFAPGFKVLTYYGSPQQRKEKRKGWNTPDSFHICITSYQLVVHDQPIFRRKKWKYMILDEAHNIKNFKSQRWKALLNFNTENRILLTGTPLQNNIMELWSLLYFLMPTSREGDVTMPEGFADLMDFQQWFGKPVDKIIQQGGKDNETKETVHKLHQVLRPYLLRRLKKDVEKQMPAKYEHIVYCRLSKRQRLLYDDFMSRAQTKETLASGNFLSIINCLMQLRKVCNHPDLFEVRPILTSFSQEKSIISNFESNFLKVNQLMKTNEIEKVDLSFLNMNNISNCSENMNSYHYETINRLSASKIFLQKIQELEKEIKDKSLIPNFNDLELYYEYLLNEENINLLNEMSHKKYINDYNCDKSCVISPSLINMLSMRKPKVLTNQLQELKLMKSVSDIASDSKFVIKEYAFVTPKAVCTNFTNLMFPDELKENLMYDSQNDIIENPFHQIQVSSSIAFPDKSLLQYDCGKLQKLATLLSELIPQGHRVLIFTQMSKVLDILELFLNYRGYTYMRLDGATKIEDRQLLTESFNNDTRVKCFILSTRAGGLGINLTGADTVIFYDSDWNPAIDKQCQDRCHRIGQTRDVHIYRFVSEYTIEANILKKAEQKKYLDDVVIQEGDFTTDYFNKVSVQELLGKSSTEVMNEEKEMTSSEFTKALEMAEDEDDAKAAEVALNELEADVEDFSDDEKANGNKKEGNGNNNGNAISNSNNKEGEEAAEAEALAVRIAEREKHKHLYSNEDVEQNGNGNGNGDENGNEEEEEEYEDDDDSIGHIDEYMIRFIAGGYYFD